MLALLALSPSTAVAASPTQVIRDCYDDGSLSRNYTNAELRKARDQLPSDLDEYSDCREVLSNAIKRGPGPDAGGPGAGGSGPGGGGGTGPSAADAANFANTPEEQAARAQDQADLDALTGSGDGPPPVDVGGQTIRPGENGLFDLASASNDLPTPLLLALIALGLAAVAGGVLALRSRVPGLAQGPLLSKIKIPSVGRPRFRR